MMASEIVAKIEGGAFGPGHSAKVWSRGSHTRVYVTRYGRQERGYIEVKDDTLDLSKLSIAGMGEDRVRAALGAA